MRTPPSSLPLIILLTACSTTYIREDDAGMDATVDDAQMDDAWAPDAYSRWPWVGLRDANNDALVADVRFPSDESCNGLDDDFDGIIDENNPTYSVCGETYVCAAGVCRCPDGYYACGSPMPSPCDVTDITTREHCGGCAPCSQAEDCSTEGGTPHCVPARIVDFTVPFADDPRILCIIREQDHHLVCRGIGPENSINWAVPWEDFGEAQAVRAWGTARQIHVLVAQREGSISFFRRTVSSGWGHWSALFSAPMPLSYFSAEGGLGFALTASGAPHFRWFPSSAVLWEYGYGTILGPEAFPWRHPFAGAGGRRPFMLYYEEGESHLATWGRPVPGLSNEPEAALGTTVDVGSLSGTPIDLACYGDYCCAVMGNASWDAQGLVCWGGPGPEVVFEPIDLNGAPLVAGDPWSRRTNTAQVFPTPAGPRLCVGQYCLDLRTIHDPPPSPAGHPLTFDPSALVNGYARPDWRASCEEDFAGGFRCNGMHSGWPEP